MNVASLDLCRELYELSGWGAKTIDKSASGDIINSWYQERTENNESIDVTLVAPQYDLGYLLRKLPEETQVTMNSAGVIIKVKSYFHKADTPEDAACKLAIELFKQKVLDKS